MQEPLRWTAVMVSMDARHWFSPRTFRNPGVLSLVVLMMLAMPVARSTAGEDVPIPAPRPEQPGNIAAPAAKDAPLPEERPAGEPQQAESLDPKDVPKPQARPAGPEPSPKPSDVDKETAEPGGTDKPDGVEISNMPLPRPTVMPAEEAACRVRLKALGVDFEERPQLADPSGCSVPWPVAVTTLSADVTLQPEAVMNCAAAERAAWFMRDHIGPKAKSILGSDIASIQQASAYVCRPRNGTTKLSEHAFGNALDIGGFILKDGRTVTVGGAAKRSEGEFMLAVRLAACGPFATVLGPGSDADHATHFHFDLAKRRPGSAFCQ
jgi:hypothetical protein